MDRETLIEALKLIPAKIKLQEATVLNAQANVIGLKRELQSYEDRCLLGMVEGKVIDGKNEATRAAQLREGTDRTRRAVDEAEIALDAERIQLRYLQAEFAALRSVARLMGGGD